ncbi:MAG: TonB family protein [Nannocystaceae bacterium]
MHRARSAAPIRRRAGQPSHFIPLQRELRDLLRNPVAFVGGILSTLAVGGAMAAALLIGDARADAEADDALVLDIDFNAGALVRQGVKDDDPIPEKRNVRETVAAGPDAASVDTVTPDAEARPVEPERPARPDTPVRSQEPPDPQKPPDTPVSTTNTRGTTPYPDPATAAAPVGDPFGSADGWAERAKDGDPWATGVIGALNTMKVPSYAAQQRSGTFQFQIEICADGTIPRVTTKKSTGDAQLDRMLVTAVTATKIPRPPPEVARQLGGKCKKIPYRFTWASGGVVE